MHRTLTLAILLVLPAAAGCVTNQSTASAMYSAQFDCPEEQVEWDTVGGYTAIMVRGCGFQQLYACNNATCVAQGERRAVGPTAGGEQ